MFAANRTLESLGAGISSLLKSQGASLLPKHHGTDISSCTSNAPADKGKPEKPITSSILEPSTKKHTPKCESESTIKHPVDDSSKTCNPSGLLASVDPRSEQRKGAVGLPGGLIIPKFEIPFCPSPANSIFSATQYKEAKQSFTELSDCASSVDRSRESGEDFFEGSVLSDESSASGFSSVIYKPHQANDVRWEAIQAVQSRYGTLELKHFRLLMPIGSGDIGTVYLSELTGTATYFAIKVMNKARLESKKKLLRAQMERDVLHRLDHPFLPTLYTHFETDKSSFLVMEFCPGGDLHVLIQRQPGRCFSEQATRFYVAEVLLALEYLHMLGIVYRDLKPENVLVREDGHIMLSDFDLSLRCSVSPTVVKSPNLTSAYCVEPACLFTPDCSIPLCFSPAFLLSSSKTRRDKKSARASKMRPEAHTHHQVAPLPELIAEPTSARSMSFVGTHEYLAPEIIKGEGHGSAVDWWTLGIFLYELLFGKTPFCGADNRATLFNVVGQPLRFPDWPVVSFAARDLIRGLLAKEPHRRLAYRRGATEIKQHPFFQSVNWALIRCAAPPQVPPPFVANLARSAKPAASRNAQLGPDVKPSGDFYEIDFF